MRTEEEILVRLSKARTKCKIVENTPAQHHAVVAGDGEGYENP